MFYNKGRYREATTHTSTPHNMKRKKSCTLTNLNFFFLLFLVVFFLSYVKLLAYCSWKILYNLLNLLLLVCISTYNVFWKAKFVAFFAFLVNLIYIFLNIFFFSIIFVCVCFKEWMTAHKILTMLKKGGVKGNLWEEKMLRVDGVGV